MKKLLLIGDSIRMGYCNFVKELLQDKTEVYYTDDNARYAQYTLRCLHDWQGGLKWPVDMDVIHWNNGLWDLLHMNSAPTGCDGEAAGETITPPHITSQCSFDKEPLTPPDMYAYMLKRVHTRIRQIFPEAKIVFATSTPVIEEQASWAYRSNAEIKQYNQIARDVLTPLGVRINELGAFAEANCSHLHRDWVHFNDEGSQLLAKEIVDYLSGEGLI